jgi:hypothetical protein
MKDRQRRRQLQGAGAWLRGAGKLFAARRASAEFRCVGEENGAAKTGGGMGEGELECVYIRSNRKSQTWSFLLHSERQSHV